MEKGFENSMEATESGVIERAREWLKKNSKVIVLGAALFSAGGVAGITAEKKFIEGASEEKIEEIIKGDKNLGTAQVEVTQVLKMNSADVAIIAGIRLGTGARADAVAILNQEGKLVELRLLGESFRGSGKILVQPEGNKFQVTEIQRTLAGNGQDEVFRKKVHPVNFGPKIPE